MFNIILFTPQIPQNTGNIIRLCANTGCNLHLIEPMGFKFDSSKMRRSGLDYHEFTPVKLYKDWQEFLNLNPESLYNTYALTTHGHNQILQTQFNKGDYFLFGSETAGLPVEVRQSFDAEHLIRLPMMPNNRSLNLANSVSILVFQAWGQHNFIGGT